MKSERASLMPVAALAIAAVALVGARFAREAAGATQESTGEPYAPSPTSAPLVSLGFREVTADLLWIRLTGYFGGPDATAPGIAALVDAIVALDPNYHRPYEYGARAITIAPHGVSQASYLHAIAVLEKGMTIYPDDWKLPYLAGEIYTQDLQTTDPAQRRAWDERGTLLTESAIRKPRAPVEAATWAATMRTRLGQHQRAVDGLREMLLVTNDDTARARLLAKLADLEASSASELAIELLDARHAFQSAWMAARPTVPASMFVLIGRPLSARFDLGTLATGGRDLVGTQAIERPEPVTEP